MGQPVNNDVLTMSSDSTEDTKKHIQDVRDRMGWVVEDLDFRAGHHDESKFDPEEKVHLDRMKFLTDTEGQVAYGTSEYKARVAILGPMLEHHYANNDHHPEHFKEGIAGMNLMSLTEMFCDWAAASSARDPDATMNLTYSIEKYQIPPMLASILRNTADRLKIKHK